MVPRISKHSSWIASIAENSFESLVNLCNLNLRKNKLTSIPANLVSHMGKLEFFDLRDNQIESMSGVVFPSKLKYVQLQMNRIGVSELDDSVQLPPPGRDWSAHELQTRASFPAIQVDRNDLMELLKQFPVLKSIVIRVDSHLDVRDLSAVDLHQSCPELQFIEINGHTRQLMPPPPSAAPNSNRAPHSENDLSGASHHCKHEGTPSQKHEEGIPNIGKVGFVAEEKLQNPPGGKKHHTK